MKPFDYHQTTAIKFGCGRAREAGAIVSGLGTRCLLVTEREPEALKPAFAAVKASLKAAGIAFAQFDGVLPNPTTDLISAGARMARDFRADVVIGLGGGSSMDAAKAIAVEATHEGTAWDYLFYKKAPTANTLPIVAITTTSGTGSQVTQVAVLTHTALKDKSAIYHPNVFPRVAIVDPEMTASMPPAVTASTGFDAFTHAFESLLHPNTSPYVKLLGEEALRLVVASLPGAIADGADVERRSAMAWADTLAGLCIASAGVTLPHGIGMAISGIYPHVPHGKALAVTYPTFARLTAPYAVESFAWLARLLDPRLGTASSAKAAEAAPDRIGRFLASIGMACRLRDFDVRETELPALARQAMVLPDYKGNPYVITSEKEMAEFLQACY